MDMILENSTNTQSDTDSGFPFDDDRNRINIRSYLDDIAARHPEFADQLREPSWSEDFVSPSLARKRRGSNFRKEEENCEEASGSSQKPEAAEPRQNLKNFGLRNTVPLGSGAFCEEERRQRSMSAPPDDRVAGKNKRFVSKCDISVTNDPMEETSQSKSDTTKGVSEPVQQKINNPPNVRVIPIQVEGRDTPIVNTNIDASTNFGSEAFRDTSFEGRLPRDFGSYQRHSPRFAHKDRASTPPQYQYAPHYQQYGSPQNFMPTNQQFTSQQHFIPPQQQTFTYQQPHAQKPPAPPPLQPQQQQPSQQHQQQQQQQYQQQQPQQSSGFKGDETDSKPSHQAKPEPPIKDPIEKVQVIQKEVEELMRQVESFNGNSRTDKQYLMLDELLTRQLLLLDNIDAEGKENVRQARKDTIRSIQRCISTLENKVPLIENKDPGTETKEVTGEEVKEVSCTSQAMEVDQTKEGTPLENKENQSMDVDEKGNKEPQPPPGESKEKV